MPPCYNFASLIFKENPIGENMTAERRFLLYCDENNTQSAHYMLIGGLWIPQECKDGLSDRLAYVRRNFNMSAEFKWTKVSRSKLPAYYAWVDCFFDSPEVGFRCIVIDTHLLDYRTFHKNDQELGFYKFYFQLISRNIEPGNLYWLYTDERNNRKRNRLEVLRIITNRYWLKKANTEPLRAIEPRRSHEEDLLQLADVLLGAVGYAWNSGRDSPAKMDLMSYIAKRLGWPSLRLATLPSVTRFNIWHWKPSGQTRVKNNRPRS